MEEYQIIKIKFDDQTEVCHHLFYKKHKLGKSDQNSFSSRTLFVNNVPPYCAEQGLKNVFGTFGKVEHVIICSKPSANPFIHLETNEHKSYFDQEHREESNCFKVAYVVFASEQSLEKSLKKPTDKENILNKDKNVSTGMKKWIEEYKKNFVDAKSLNKEIDEFMKNYDQEIEMKEKELSDNLNQPDEDGWITVTPKSRKSNKTFTEKNIDRIKNKEKKRRQKMQLINFYSFQIKESKKEYISQLRKKFEEDKKRIEAMKQARKFKPF